MLLHVIATHSQDNCPAYHRDRMPAMMEALEKREEMAREFHIRLHYVVSAAPEHAFYALLEADSFPSVSRFLMEMLPIPHDFRLTVVQPAEELIGAWKPTLQK